MPTKAARPVTSLVPAAPPEAALAAVSTAARAIPDLVAATPSLRVDATALGQALTFAFASGAPGSMLDDLLNAAALPDSTWDPACFARDVFLPELVASFASARIEGRRHPLRTSLLVRMLTRPPADRATVELRRGVVAELVASPEARTGFERIYAAIARFRAQLEAGPLAATLGVTRRRLDVLGALQAAIDAMADAFDGATSALSRLRSFAGEVRASDAYRRLAELLDWEDHLATLDVRLRLGSDGRVRALELLSVRENEQNRHHQSPLGRLFTKLRLALSGYRFGDEELVARLLDGVFEGLEAEAVRLLQLLGDMELYLFALALADRARDKGLEVCLPDFAEDRREIRDLWNPLLAAGDGPVVPCDVASERQDETVIVTGPNSGGKTRLLQSLAFVQTLGQSGLLVPASRARIGTCDGIFASLVDEPRADQSEGRLGTELLRIRNLFEKLRFGSMVLVDELCSGTNPSEGEEMFELVVSLLGELHPQAFVTTHFLTLAAAMEREPPAPRLAFLQVELDARQWPTYRFVPGVAVTSLAQRTAARLGVTRDELRGLVEASKRARRR